MERFAYDAARRLASVTDDRGTVLERYAYDAAGQRIEKSSLNGASVPETPFEASYDAANRMTQITLEPGTPQAKTYDLGYNASGQLITKQNRASPADTTTYGWDTRGRLTSLSAPGVEASFSYDPLGRRSERRVNGQSTRYVYDGVQALGELREDANGNATLLTGVGMDEMIARYTQAGERSFLTDALGSVIALAKEDQSVVTRYAYSPYGQSQTSGAQEGNASQYTARENDGTGLYYYRARYYDAALKRFVSEDPIGLAGGINVYGYVDGDPINLTDPLGLRGARGGSSRGGRYDSPYFRRDGVVWGAKLPPVDALNKDAQAFDKTLQELPESICDYWPAYCVPKIPPPSMPHCKLVCPDDGFSCAREPVDGVPSFSRPGCYTVCTKGPVMMPY